MNRLIGLLGATAALILSATPAFAGIIPVVPTPEPASIGLLAVGIGGVALARFRRRK